MASPPDDLDPLSPALDALTQAESPAALLAAHRAVTKAIRRKRQGPDGPLAQTYVAAMAQWDQEKADGVPEAERLQHLQTVLRSAWPVTRAWKYLCARCDDTGLVIAVCRKGQRCDGISTRIDSPNGTPGKYKRLCAQHPDSDYEHPYGVPCPCPKGARFRIKPKPTGDDFTDSGRGKAMTKVGRR